MLLRFMRTWNYEWYVKTLEDFFKCYCLQGRKTSKVVRVDFKKKQLFTKEEHKKIYPSGCEPALLYVNPKVYKLKSKTDVLDIP